MNAEQLLAHFHLISEAPDAIPRLRRFILDLAVRGKLTDQDPREEPAPDLLGRIKAEEARLVWKGEMRRQTPLPPVSEGEAPFNLPSAWVWTRVGQVFIYDAGTKREPKDLEPDLWLLELEDIEKDTSVVLARLSVKERAPCSTKAEFKMGDILYGKLRPYLNKVVVATEGGYSTTEIVSIRSIIPLCPQYCCIAFRRPDFVDYVTRMGKGTKMPRLRTPDAVMALFPLPPLAEQRRIVAKVDELMALCDRLEAAQVDRESRRYRLVVASLRRLSQPAEVDAADFREHAHFFLGHLARFTARTEQIQQIRQTILNLAVRGRLVPQDPDDEPAFELLKRIQEEKARLVKTGVLRKEKHLTLVSGEKAPFTLPPNWSWARIGACSLSIEYGTSVKSDHSRGGVPVIRMGDIQEGRIIMGGQKNVPRHIDDLPRLFLKRLDLLYNRTNSADLVGKTGIYLGEDDVYTFASYLIRIRFFVKLINPSYMNLAMRAPYFRETQIVPELRQQCGQANVNGSKLRNMVIPLPPLSEQDRIAAKAEELLALGDQLEAQLTTVQTERRRLLEVLASL